MKIGIDARLLSRPLTGIGRYSFEICRVLAAQKNVSLYLYSPALYTCSLSDFSYSTLRHHHWRGSFQRQLWGEIFLPLEARKDFLDLFWGPAHRLPRFLPSSVAKIVTIHDLVWREMPKTMRRATLWLERLHTPSTLRRADSIAVVSQATAAALKREFPSLAEKVCPILCGTSRILAPQEPLFLDQYEIKRPYFLFVGTLEPRKNLSRLLEAYAALPESLRQKVSFVIAGGKGWGKETVKEHIEHLNLSQNVHVTGYVDETLLSTLYAHALFLAMPSLGEGFGLPLTEAMSLGVPVLTSDRSSMPEVAGDAGLFVDPLNINSIQQGLFDLITKDSLRQTYASKAFAQAQKFSWDKAGTQLLQLFQNTLERKRLSL